MRTVSRLLPPSASARHASEGGRVKKLEAGKPAWEKEKLRRAGTDGDTRRSRACYSASQRIFKTPLIKRNDVSQPAFAQSGTVGGVAE